MKAIEIKPTKNRFVISIDKSLIDLECLNKIIDRVKFEYLVKKGNFNEKILNIGDDIKKDWWGKNKKDFLKGIEDEDCN